MADPTDPGPINPHLVHDRQDGRTLSDAEIVDRNAEIVAARIRGLGFEQIARTYGLSSRRVREIYQHWREANPPIRSLDPLAIIDDVTTQLTGAAEELALVAATTNNDNARVGAIRARLDALGQLTGLLQEIGALPRDLGRLRVELDVRYVAEQILLVFEEEGIEPRVQERIVGLLSRATTSSAN